MNGKRVTWLLLLLLVVGCKQKPKAIPLLQPGSTNEIVVYNRGDFSNYDTRTIVNRDSIKVILSIIRMARWVDWETINLKNTVKYCRFEIIDTNNKKHEFTYSVTGHSGDILEYNYHYYRANELYKFLK